MSNPILEYLNDPKLGIAGKNWTPAATPSLVSEVPGFQLGEAAAGQLPAVDFARQSLGAVWSALPGDVRADMVNAVADIINVGSQVGAVLSPFAAMAGPLVAYAQAIMKAPEWVENLIGGTIETNDKRRYNSRLAAVELLEAAGPRHWTFENYLIPTYARDRGIQKSVTNMAWPPDINSMLTTAVVARSGDCSQGGGDLAPRSSSCKGSITLTPIFMPVWSQRALGSPGPWVSMRKGMERSQDGGARIWQKMLQMQAALLIDPVVNLYANGEKLWAFAQRFSGIASEALENSGWVVDPEYIDDPPKLFGPDSTPDNPILIPRFYRTPGGLYGVYISGGGTTESEILGEKIGYPKEKREHPTYSSFGGNVVSFANYNSVMSAVGQFFALRKATLQSKSTCQSIVDAGPAYIDAIPEPKLREAVKAVAAGVTLPPTGAGASGFGLAAGPVQPPKTPGGPWSLATIPPKAPSNGMGPVLAVLGIGALWKLLR